MHLLHPAQCKNKIIKGGWAGGEKKKKDCTRFRSTLEAIHEVRKPLMGRKRLAPCHFHKSNQLNFKKKFYNCQTDSSPTTTLTLLVCVTDAQTYIAYNFIFSSSEKVSQYFMSYISMSMRLDVHALLVCAANFNSLVHKWSVCICVCVCVCARARVCLRACVCVWTVGKFPLKNENLMHSY